MGSGSASLGFRPSIVNPAVFFAQAFMPFGAGDTHVEMVVMGAGVSRLKQQCRRTRNVLPERGPCLGIAEQALPEVGRDEHVLHFRALVSQPHLHHEPIAVIVELEAASVFCDAVGVERYEGVEALWAALLVQDEETDIRIAPALVRMVAGEGAAEFCGKIPYDQDCASRLARHLFGGACEHEHKRRVPIRRTSTTGFDVEIRAWFQLLGSELPSVCRRADREGHHRVR